jgi:hypothetical protein
MARRPRRLQRIRLDERCRSDAQQRDQRRERGIEPAVEPPDEPAGREREDEVDQHREDQPRRDAPDAVRKARRGFGERGERPQHSGADEQVAEAQLARRMRREDADRHGRGDDRQLEEGAIEALLGRGARRDERDGERADGDGDRGDRVARSAAQGDQPRRWVRRQHRGVRHVALM